MIAGPNAPFTIGGLLKRLREDDPWRATSILLVSAVSVTTWHYFGAAEVYQRRVQGLVGDEPVGAAAAAYEMVSALVLLGAAPIAYGRFVLGQKLNDFGLRLGAWRRWSTVFLVLAPAIVAISWFSSTSPAIAAEYPLHRGAGESMWTFARHALMQLAFYLGWELHFRGFLQFGLAPATGREVAGGVSVLASCLAHFGKPPLETFASILGGAWWSFHAFRCRSIGGGLLQHWLLGASLDYFLCFG